MRKYLYRQFCYYVSFVNGKRLRFDWPIGERCSYIADVRIRVLPVTLFSEQLEDIAPNVLLLLLLLLLRDFIRAKSHKNATVGL